MENIKIHMFEGDKSKPEKTLGANLDYPTLYWSKRTPPGAQVFFHRGGLE